MFKVKDRLLTLANWNVAKQEITHDKELRETETREEWLVRVASIYAKTKD